jgi:hypothetical protein
LSALLRSVWATTLGVVALGVLWLATASASAALTWSAPTFLDVGLGYSDAGLVDIACPTASGCVAVDSVGREVSFDPADPGAWSAYSIDGTRALTGLSCPSASLCVAVDGSGAAITFDPELIGAAPTRYSIDPGPAYVLEPGDALVAVSCPSTGLCIAVDQQGHVISFSPVGPPDAQMAGFSAEQTLGGQHLLACASGTRCSVLGSTGAASETQSPAQTLITFDPRTLEVVASATVPSSVGLTQLVCPAADECVGAGLSLSLLDGHLSGSGTATVAFDLASSVAAPAVVRGTVAEFSIACASASLCTAMDASGAELSFDPNGPGVLEQRPVDPLGDYGAGFNGSRIACPSADECVLATWNDAAAITFAPLSPGSPVAVPIDDGAPISALACPAHGDCIGLGNTQGRYTLALSVEALLGQGSQSHVHGTEFFSGKVGGFACPSRRQCTAVTTGTLGNNSRGSWSATFDPVRPAGRLIRAVRGVRIDLARVTGLACATRRECTAVDTRGRAVSFDPNRPRVRAVYPESERVLGGIACPSATQCTAVGADGIEVTFAPATGLRITRSQIDGTTELTAVACPTPRQCSAVDRLGREISFDPQEVGHLVAHQIGTAKLTGISCPSRHRCVAVATGEVAFGDPGTWQRWTVEAVPGASSLLAVACSSMADCVATDSVGHTFETIGAL